MQRNPIITTSSLLTALAFPQHRQVVASVDMPAALSSALAAHPTVVMAGSEKSARATLLVPLGPSPFHRLLLHAVCQYRNLRSRSELLLDGVL